MASVFGRHCRTTPATVVAGEGVYLIDCDGRRYLDGSGGAAVSCLGHSDRDVRRAIHEQLDRIAFAHTSFFTSEPAEELADLLAEQAPAGITKVYLVSGGSEAVEAAIKLARQYFLDRGEPKRHHVIARRQSYHGSSLGALAAGGNSWRRKPFAPLLVGTSHISPCFAYRGRAQTESLDQYGQRVACELEAEIERIGPERVMAFIAEPVVGATAGAVPPVRGYFKKIRGICDKFGILLIADEVMCGMGRTGSLFALEQESVRPDIVTVAKGLGAGYQPIGAMLCQQELFDTIASNSGSFRHGHTYMGHPLAAAAATAVLKAILDRDLVTRVLCQGEKLQNALNSRFGNHPHVGDIRGRGLFRAIELVEDLETKRPFDPVHGLAARIKKSALEAGLVCYPGSGTIDGVRGDHVLLAPPFIIADSQIDELVSKLAVAVGNAVDSIA